MKGRGEDGGEELKAARWWGGVGAGVGAEAEVVQAGTEEEVESREGNEEGDEEGAVLHPERWRAWG